MAKQMNLFNVHKNSLEAYYSIKESGAKLSRCQMIIDLMVDEKERTDNEVAEALGFPHKSAVQPRLTELIQDKVLEECGTRKDPATNKNVRVVKLVTDKEFDEGTKND